MKDEESIQRIVLGEAKAFESLVHRYRGLVFKVAYTITDDWHTVEDVAQETFLRAFQNVDGLRRPGLKKILRPIFLLGCSVHLYYER